MSFVDEAVKKTLDEMYGMDEEDVDAFAEEFARVCPGATADEFVGSVAAWVEDGTSHLYDRYLVSGAQIAEAYLMGFGDGSEGEPADLEEAIGYVAPRLAGASDALLDEVDERVCDLGRADAGGDRLHDAYLKGWLDALEWVRGEAGR